MLDGWMDGTMIVVFCFVFLLFYFIFFFFNEHYQPFGA